MVDGTTTPVALYQFLNLSYIPGNKLDRTNLFPDIKEGLKSNIIVGKSL